MNDPANDISGYLIVFTDAKGSTEADESAVGQPEYQAGILELREELFAGQIKYLTQENRWEIIKSVGDALVLTVKVPKSPQEASQLVNACLQELFQAWKHFNQTDNIKIRVAVHYAETAHLAAGRNLASGLKKRLENSPALASLDAFLTSLEGDLFGAGINRSARLASAPSGSLFVLSKHVVEKLLSRELTTDDIKAQLHSQNPLYPNLPLRGPIPLVKVKGVESVNPMEPWWIWELIDNNYQGAQSFGAENKRFQVIRLIQAVFPVQKSLKNRSDGDDAIAKAPDNAFNKHLKETTALTFFSDLVLKVVDSWSYYRPSDERDFSLDHESTQWKPTTDVNASWLPYYVVFTSCPNEATDQNVRDTLVTIRDEERNLPNGKGTFSLEAISYQVHRSVRWADQSIAEKGTSAGRRLYMIFFQVHSSAVDVGGDPDKLFASLPSSFGDKSTWEIISRGVTRGDKDGFLLASLEFGNQTDAELELQAFLRLECKSNGHGRNFWSRIAPIKVLVCTSLAPIAKTHYGWLKECADHHRTP